MLIFRVVKLRGVLGAALKMTSLSDVVEAWQLKRDKVSY